MIAEAVLGFIVSFLAIVIFLSLNYSNSVNKWIIETSKFIYYTGHPLMDDEAKYRAITSRFKQVFLSLASVILKTTALLLSVALIIAFTSAVYILFRGESLPGIHSGLLPNALYPDYLYQIPFIAGTFLPIILVPFVYKNKKTKSTPYSSIEKLLHYVFLGNSNLAKFLFRIELKRHRKELKSKSNQPTQNIYISGLARAGTTALMQYLGEISQFSSLSYRNMPLLFLPQTWPKLSSKKKVEEKERFHKDGMTHSIDSYEALEEPFWRTYNGMDYVKTDALVSYDINENVYEKYTSFRKLVAGDKTYLAKNNNHLLRAASLHQLDLSAGNITRTIIPIREPYAQAKSLLNQHQNLSQLQNEDEFVKDYMDFLVHHEFGLSHKISVFDNSNQLELPTDQNSMEYWLEVWYIFYSKAYFLFSEQEGFYFFCYEEFCKRPYESLLTLASKINLPKKEIDALQIKHYEIKKNPGINPKSKYSELYNKLAQRSINYTHG